MSNPILQTKFLEQAKSTAQSGVMTISETINKIYILLGLLVVAGGFSWYQGVTEASLGYVIVLALVGFGVALLTTFKPTWAPITAPIYAVIEGLLLGIISRIYEDAYGGLVLQAVMLTLTTLGVMLFLYSSRIIKATENLKIGIIAATGGIALVYLATLVLGLFGISIPFIHDNGPIGIGFSVLVVGIAAFNLILDFDFIEQGAAQGLPRYMEWYGAFGLMVTIVWLYLEMLRLLSKLRGRD